MVESAAETTTRFDTVSPNKKDLDELRLNLDNLMAFEDTCGGLKLGIDFKQNVKQITDKILKKVDSLVSEVHTNNFEIDAFSVNLISMKKIGDSIPALTESVNQKIDQVLREFKNKRKDEGGLALAKLSTALENDADGVGQTIIAEHAVFKGQAISLFNQETQRHNIDYVLSKLEGDGVDSDKLRRMYDSFDKSYTSLVKENIMRCESCSITDKEDMLCGLVSKIKLIPRGVVSRHKSNAIKWDANVRETIPSLMAHLFAFWTLKNTEYFSDMKVVDVF